MDKEHKCPKCDNNTFIIKMFESKPMDVYICDECSHCVVVDYSPMTKEIKASEEMNETGLIKSRI